MFKLVRPLFAAPMLLLAACSQAPAEPSPLAQGDWTLDSDDSTLSYVTVKAGEIAEVNGFNALSGSVAENGNAQIEIDLASVNTGIDIRDERMREVFFKVADNPSATINAQIDPAAFGSLGVGESITRPVSATVSLAGVEREVETELVATRIADDRVLVVPAAPIIVEAGSFGLEEGLGKLQELAGLPSITPAVPVTFSLTFERQ